MAKRSVKGTKRADAYQHEEQALLRPEAGTQARFRKRRPPRAYRYDSSLSPALDWDGQNPGRETGEWLLRQIEEAARLDPPQRFAESRRFGDLVVEGLSDAVARLKALGRPFLDWAGKAERLSFDVPTLPLFVHERLSTKAILETLKAHERDRQMELQLFGRKGAGQRGLVLAAHPTAVRRPEASPRSLPAHARSIRRLRGGASPPSTKIDAATGRVRDQAAEP